ncbi:MAG: hydroxymethylglutaryl-CoA synthase family protein [Polyangiales bacterium]
MTTSGITSIGIKVPSRFVDVREVAALRGIDPNKYTKGLGCHQFAVCGEGEDAVSLGAGAATRALSAWGGDMSDIGLLVAGTETAKDMSRPLSAFIAERLKLQGAMRSYEVKHACYGGTLALRQALEWHASGAAKGRSALVIATDVSLYAQADPGEATQGAGAIAMVVGAPDVAEVDLVSAAWSEPAFDFWRPVGEAHPRVDGPLSLDCYKRGAWETMRACLGDDLAGVDALESLCFHTPFPKMVQKAVRHIAAEANWDEAKAAALYESKVLPSMRYNRRIGNSYTASLWIAVSDVLRDASVDARIGAYSYGSGFGSEFLQLRATGAEAHWHAGLEADFAAREELNASAYDTWRKSLAA